MQLIQQMALVGDTSQLSEPELSAASAALQKQLTRDLGPVWGINATIDSFARLEDVPLGYWPVLIQNEIPYEAAGIHLDKDGQPFALVVYSNQWTLTASHEVIEMSVDPWGDRLVASRSLKEDQGRVEYLVEVADPSEAAEFAYRINGVLVSDFYTPQFFDIEPVAGTRYSFGGHITKPREVLPGGYISWHDPPSDHWWQQIWFDAEPEFKDLGVFSGQVRSLRAEIDRRTVIPQMQQDLPEGNPKLQEAMRSKARGEVSSSARAERLRAQIDEITNSADAPGG